MTSQPSSVQSLSRVRLFASLWTAACWASLSVTNSRSLFKLMSVDSVMPSNHLILCCPLSSRLLSLPVSGSFQISQYFALGGQSTKVSASASVLPMNIQFWFPLAWTGWFSLQSKGLPGVFPSITVWKHHFFMLNILSATTLAPIHDYWKNHSFNYKDFCLKSDVSAF